MENKCPTPYNMEGVVEGEATCWQQPLLLPHMHVGVCELLALTVATLKSQPHILVHDCTQPFVVFGAWPLVPGNSVAPLASSVTFLSLKFFIKMGPSLLNCSKKHIKM